MTLPHASVTVETGPRGRGGCAGARAAPPAEATPTHSPAHSAEATPTHSPPPLQRRPRPTLPRPAPAVCAGATRAREGQALGGGGQVSQVLAGSLSDCGARQVVAAARPSSLGEARLFVGPSEQQVLSWNLGFSFTWPSLHEQSRREAGEGCARGSRCGQGRKLGGGGEGGLRWPQLQGASRSIWLPCFTQTEEGARGVCVCVFGGIAQDQWVPEPWTPEPPCLAAPLSFYP